MSENMTCEELQDEIISLKKEYGELREKYEAIRKSERKFKAIFDNIHDAINYIDKEGTIIDVNKNVESVGGYTREEIIGKKITDFDYIFSDSGIDPIDTAKEFLSSFPWKNLEFEATHKNGNKINVEVSGGILEEDGEVIGYILMVRDITHRKMAQEALKESEEKYRQLVNLAPAGMYEVDFQKGRIISANDVFCEITGYTQKELFAINPFDLAVGDRGDYFRKRVETFSEDQSSQNVVEQKLKGKNNREFWTLLNYKLFWENGLLKRIAVVLLDITDRKHAEAEKLKLETQLQIAQKMEAIGTLAGGIAHDFNNILGAIMLNAEMAYDAMSGNKNTQYFIEQVLLGSRRARDLVHQILTFSRDTDVKRESLNITAIVKETLKMLRSIIPATIIFRNDISPDLKNINADPVQIQQLVMNLCSNASYAMKETGGRLTVAVKNVSFDQLPLDSGLEQGEFVGIIVSDSGSGILPENRDRIFDPFFTTKQPGEGTGLGLSVVHGIVKRSDGYINVNSEPGKGTIFKIYFPCVDVEDIPAQADSQPLPCGDEEILFIDDEKPLAEASKKMLEFLGYKVTVQNCGNRALQLFEKGPGRFDLIITDMTMPNMTGVELAGKAMEIRPDIPIIVCTGFSHLITKEKAQKIGIREFVMKPFSKMEMAETIRKVLDG
jgi:PAS domain S-box-containing protein